jgi:aryl-alcohol dehydrogenase-like predicted oxidoreductase
VITQPTVPLILGGHSFIRQLGSDPQATEQEQAQIVAACLDSGINRFDTTYQPERLALGRALKALGRRDQATIIAWNFFLDFGPEDEVGGPSYYQPHHIECLLEQLQTDYVDDLVVHAMGDESENRRQQALAVSWQEQGLVGALGVWHPGADAKERYGSRRGSAHNPYRFMVRPYNVTSAGAEPAFATAKRLGWETLACSPFVRGWELDRLVERAELTHAGPEDLRAKLADHMLRYSLFAPHVDRLIVSMRKVEWVHANVASWRRGPLSSDERAWLESLTAAR